MDLLRPWMNIHSMIREDKIKNIDNIEVYKALEKIGDAMDYYELFIDNQYFIKDIKKEEDKGE